MNFANHFQELNLSSLEQCARRWAAAYGLIERITLYRGVETPYVLVVQTGCPRSGGEEMQPVAPADLMKLRQVWEDPECLHLQDDLLEISLNDFDCSAKIGVFLGKWRSHLQWGDTEMPPELVQMQTAVVVYKRRF